MKAGPGRDRATNALAAMRTRVLPRTTAVGYYDHKLVDIARACPTAAGRTFACRATAGKCARAVVWRPARTSARLVFHWQRRAGVVLASAAQRYARCSTAAAGFARGDLHQDDRRRAASYWPRRESKSPGRGYARAIAGANPGDSGTCGMRFVAVRGGSMARADVARSRRERAMTGAGIRSAVISFAGGGLGRPALFSQSAGRINARTACSCPRGLNAERAEGDATAPSRSTRRRAGPDAGLAARGDGSRPTRRSHARRMRDSDAGAGEIPATAQPPKKFVDQQRVTRPISRSRARRDTSVEHAKTLHHDGAWASSGQDRQHHPFASSATQTARSVPQVGNTTFRSVCAVTIGAPAGREMRALRPGAQTRSRCHLLGRRSKAVGLWRRPPLYYHRRART